MAIITNHAYALPISDGQIIDFYNRNWGKKIALGISDFFHWQFIDPPSHNGKNHCIISYDTINEQICGVMGLTRRDFIIGNERLIGAELTTWIVDPLYKSLGIGGRILKKIQSEYDIAIGMGITQDALPLYMKSNFRFIKAIPRFIRVINEHNVSVYAKNNLLGSRLVRIFLKKNPDITYFAKEISTEKDLFLCKNFYNDNIYHFSRGSSDVMWRYLKHPVFKYQIFNLTVSEIEDESCLIVLRIEDSIDGVRICHVMDIFTENELLIKASLNFLNNFSQENNIDIFDFYSTSGNVNRFLISYGWFSTLDDLCFQFPHLFHPLEFRDPPTTSLIYWAKEQRFFENLCDLSRLYITKQDADLDRPTFETYSKLKL